MLYTTNHSDFNKFFKIFSKNNLIEQFFDSFYPELKISNKEIDTLFDTNDYTSIMYNTNISQLSNKEKFIHYIKHHIYSNDFNETYIPLSYHEKNFSKSLNDGINYILDGNTYDEKLFAIAEIISYVFFTQKTQDNIFILMDAKNKLKLNLIEIPETYPRINLLKIQSNKIDIYNLFKKDLSFNWKVDDIIITSSWNDIAFIRKEVDQNISNLKYVDTSLLNTDNFNQYIFSLFMKNSGSSYYDNKTFPLLNTLLNKEFEPFVIDFINDFSEKYIDQDNFSNILKIFEILSQKHFNHIQEDLKNTKNLFKEKISNALNNYLNNNIDSIPLSENNILKIAPLLSIENLNNTLFLNKVVKTINNSPSYHYRSFFEEYKNKFSCESIHLLFLNLDKDVRIISPSLFSDEKSNYFLNLTQEDILKLFLKHPSLTYNLYNHHKKPLNFNLSDFDLFLENKNTQIFIMDNLSFLPQEYFSDDTKLLKLFNSFSFNQFVVNSFIDKINNKEILLNILKSNEFSQKYYSYDDKISKLKLNSFFIDNNPKNKFDVNIISNLPPEYFKSTLLNNKRLSNFFKNISKPEADTLLLKNSLFYIYLPNIYKNNKQNTLKYIKSSSYNIYEIKKHLFQDVDICCACLNKNFLTTLPFISKDLWNNKTILLNITKNLDSNPAQINDFLKLSPEHVKTFFAQIVKLKNSSSYTEFFNTYIDKQSINDLLEMNTSNQIIPSKKINKI